MIAALYVDESGPYVGLPGVDVWGVSRDARLYPGPWPVVAHPPCERWGKYATGGPAAPGRHRKGDDGGCFVSALAAVRRWGGVLEHPAYSRAWEAYGLRRPPSSGGWVPADDAYGWTCQVDQGHFGHPAQKATWLYAVSVHLPELPWHRAANVTPVEALSRRQRRITPEPFRDLLIAIASNARSDMKTHVQLNHKVKGELAQEASKAQQALGMLHAFAIENEEDHSFAGEVLLQVKASWKELEEKRTAVTGPLNEALRTVNDWFRPVQQPLKEAERILKEKISAFIIARKAANEAAMLAAASAAQAGDGEAALVHVGAIQDAPRVAGISVKEVWDWEVENLDEVPREFLTVDERKVREAIWYADTEKRAPLPIPGLRFVLRGQVTARAR